MSATAAGRRGKRQEVAANRRGHSNLSSREELQRRLEEQQREIERLRDQLAQREEQLAEQEKQIADAGKQIAGLERQLALRKQNSTNSSKPPSSDGLAGEQRPRGRKRKSGRKPGPTRTRRGIIGDWFPQLRRAPLRCCCPVSAGTVEAGCRRMRAK